MQNFMEISQTDLFEITGGGIWGKIGSFFITIGAVLMIDAPPVGLAMVIVGTAFLAYNIATR